MQDLGSFLTGNEVFVILHVKMSELKRSTISSLFIPRIECTYLEEESHSIRNVSVTLCNTNTKLLYGFTGNSKLFVRKLHLANLF